MNIMCGNNYNIFSNLNKIKSHKMNSNEWNYDELDDIYFQKSDAELDCLKGVNRGFSPKKANSGLGPNGSRIFGGDEGKFLKSLQECLNWEEPDDEIADGYTELMRIGY